MTEVSIFDPGLFDEVIDRTNTCAIKYDYAKKRGVPENALPLWVADMDFRSPPCVNEAIAERARHGIYGYSDATPEYYSAVQNWYRTRYAYDIDVCNIVTSPGVVFGLFTAVSALTNEGECVLIQRPVYYPFSAAVNDLGRKLINNPLVYKDGCYSVDFADFEQKIIDNQIRLFILCNPHNPVGRVWSKEELQRMGEICLAHDVYIVSDEIHADFVYPGHKHTIFASLSPELSKRTITCTAPSKTFNLAGLQISNLFITDEELRKLFLAAMKKTGYSQPNLCGMIACQAAYENGGPWLDALLIYLEENIRYVREIINKEFPGVRLVEPEGTYLLWLDFSGLGLSEKDIREKIEKKSLIWLDHGTMFGPEGAGFQRINIACPKATLVEAFDRLKRGIYS
ncbi:MAG: MalY/PatB family protein [Eubacteriales bacterium]